MLTAVSYPKAKPLCGQLTDWLGGGGVAHRTGAKSRHSAVFGAGLPPPFGRELKPVETNKDSDRFQSSPPAALLSIVPIIARSVNRCFPYWTGRAIYQLALAALRLT